LSTARLRLVPLRIEEADEMTEVLADPALYAFTGGDPPSPGELRARYVVQAPGRSQDGSEAWHNWIVRTREPDHAVGYVQCTITGGGMVADVAWVIGVRWQHRGFAAEASRALVAWLDTRGVTTITAHVHPEHAASSQVAERIGLAATDTIEDGERIWRRDIGQPRPGAEDGS
jgi:RimJ/RimL family protein N-acetyltransferase